MIIIIITTTTIITMMMIMNDNNNNDNNNNDDNNHNNHNDNDNSNNNDDASGCFFTNGTFTAVAEIRIYKKEFFSKAIINSLSLTCLSFISFYCHRHRR